MAAAAKKRNHRNVRLSSDASFERAGSAFSSGSGFNIPTLKDDIRILEEPDIVWLEDNLMQHIKKNFFQNESFVARHVTVTSSQIFWTKPGQSSVLCSVLFSEIAGFYCNAMSEQEKICAFRDRDLFHKEYQGAHGDALDPLSFTIHTSYCGFHRGNVYQLRAESPEQKELWVSTLSKMFRIQKRKPWQQMSFFAVFRKSSKNVYAGDSCQIFVAVLITGNFLLNIIEAQIRPEDGSDADVIVSLINMIFTSIFTAELALNIFANFWLEFRLPAWNWFDSVVVIVSVVSLIANNLPGVSVLRLLRAFRVFRLFKRIPSLRQVLVALNMSIPKMANAFVLVCLGTSVYSIIGVTFFKDLAPEYFGDFFTAMFTMFQVLTGDAWGDLTRDLMSSSTNPGLIGIFFVSFHLILVLILINVVIAILLDEFSKAARMEKDLSDSAGHEYRNQPPPERRCPLERMAKEFSAFDSLEYIDRVINHAWSRILALTFEGENLHEIDEETESIEFRRLSMGLKDFGYIPPILFHEKHWDNMIVRTGLSTKDNKINLAGFRILIRRALWRYHLNQVSMGMDIGSKEWDSTNVRAVFLSVKGILLLEYESVRQAEAEAQKTQSPSPARGGGQDSFDGLLQFLEDLGAVRMRFEKLEKDLIELREEPPTERRKSLSNEAVMTAGQNGEEAHQDKNNTPANNNSLDFFKIPKFESNFKGLFGPSILTHLGSNPAAPPRTSDTRSMPASTGYSNPVISASASNNSKQPFTLSNITDEPIRAILSAFGQKPPAGASPQPSTPVLEGFHGLGKGILDGLEGITKGFEHKDQHDLKAPPSMNGDAHR